MIIQDVQGDTEKYRITSEGKIVKIENDTVYVIQFQNISQSSEVDRIKKKIKSLNSDKEVLIQFQAPYQRVIVSEFYSREEADEFRKLLKEEFPNTIILPSVPPKN